MCFFLLSELKVPPSPPQIVHHPLSINGANRPSTSKEHKKPEPQKIVVQKKRVTADDDVIQILNWKPSWILQQMTLKKCPPVSKDEPLQMTKAFKNYVDYHRVVNPLLMMELWNYIQKDVMSTNSKK